MLLRMTHFERSGFVKWNRMIYFRFCPSKLLGEHLCKFEDSVEVQELRQTQRDVVTYCVDETSET